jgi:outer membrane biosynthesis protein TonB
MKRCPQCEFIYEDDQSLCDMDGILLVFDSRTLPNHHALATVPPRPSKRNRAVPAFATLILALVLGMVYYVSTRRPAISPAPAMTTAAVPEPVVNPTPEAQPAEVPKEEEKPAATKEPSAAPAKKPTAKAAPQPKTSTQAKKDDSKVGSILKKTGRILKKPFKF